MKRAKKKSAKSAANVPVKAVKQATVSLLGNLKQEDEARVVIAKMIVVSAIVVVTMSLMCIRCCLYVICTFLYVYKFGRDFQLGKY